MPVECIDVSELHRRLDEQGVSAREHFAFVCPMCRTVQSATSLMKAGAGQSMQEVEKYLGFSCVGRFLDAPAPRKEPDGNPCNWTLGGVFRLHKLEIVDPDGKHHPYFEIASRDDARKLEAANV